MERNIQTAKRDLRAFLKRKRDTLPGTYRREASERMAACLAGSGLYRDAQRVFAYWAIGSEADLTSLLCAGKDRVFCLPMIGDNGHMEAGLYEGTLRNDRFGIPSPPEGSKTIPPGQLDLILCPALSIDGQGYRLGYGGGYYDRYLKRSRAVRVGVCYEEMLADMLPHDGDDQPVDWILTEVGLRKTGIQRDG